MFKRRHHCRSCNQSYCDKHSSFKGRVSKDEPPQRLCRACAVLGEAGVLLSSSRVQRASPLLTHAFSDARGAVIVDQRRLVDAMKCVVNHRYSGAFFHDSATKVILDDRCPKPNNNKDVVEEDHRRMRHVFNNSGLPLELAKEEERTFVECGHFSRQFLYKVLWSEHRIYGQPGEKLFAGMTDNGKDVLCSLLEQLEHMVVLPFSTSERSAPHPEDTLLVPYLPTVRGVDLSFTPGDAPSTVAAAKRDREDAANAAVGPVMRLRWNLRPIPRELFSRLVARLLKDAAVPGMAHVKANYGACLSFGWASHETPGLVENVMVWHQRDSNNHAAPPAGDGDPPSWAYVTLGSIHVQSCYVRPQGDAAGASALSQPRAWRGLTFLFDVVTSVLAEFPRVEETLQPEGVPALTFPAEEKVAVQAARLAKCLARQQPRKPLRLCVNCELRGRDAALCCVLTAARAFVSYLGRQARARCPAAGQPHGNRHKRGLFCLYVRRCVLAQKRRRRG